MKKCLTVVLLIIFGLMIMTACSNDSTSDDMDSAGDTVSDEVADTDDGAGDAEASSFDSEKIKEQIELTELGKYTEAYINATNYGYATLAKNNSDQDIILSCSITFYGDDEAPVATADSIENYVNAGGTALLFADDEMDPYEKADVELTVEKPNSAVLSNQMNIKETLRSDKVIIEMTNGSKMNADPAGAAIAYYNGDELVDCQYVYCTTHDEPLEIGDTVTKDNDWISNSNVDSVKVYPNALSNGIKALPDSLEGNITRDDFIIGGDAAYYWKKNVSSVNSTSYMNTNDLTEVLEKSGDFVWVYYTAGEDASEEGVITTARGIHLGDGKDAVIKAYGKGEEVKFNPDKDPYYQKCDSSEQALIKEKASKSVEYQMDDEPFGIVFYYDSHDKVSLVFFTRN